MKKISHIIILATIVFLSACGDSKEKASVAGPYDQLKELALNELYKSKYSHASPGGLCDKVENVQLVDINLGTISRTTLTGELDTPLPAIVARHDYVCVISVLGTKEREEDQWVILALDEEFGYARCVRTGSGKIIGSMIQECGFKANQ